MKPVTLPAIRVDSEFRDQLESVLDETETVSSFIEKAVRDAVSHRRVQAAFLARGEEAWQQYLRTGQSSSASEVFARIQTRIDARRQQLAAKS